jgi:hypothetical protein
MTISSGSSTFTLGTTTIIDLRTYTVLGRATDGLGVAINLAGRSERYSSLKLWKIA